jgi:hypothetical protein
MEFKWMKVTQGIKRSWHMVVSFVLVVTISEAHVLYQLDLYI